MERWGLPFQCARGVCVLPLLIPISRETEARRARDWSEGSRDFKTKLYLFLTSSNPDPIAVLMKQAKRVI